MSFRFLQHLICKFRIPNLVNHLFFLFSGFSLEVTNNDNAIVIVGVRVMLGGVDINRVPSFIEMHGRNLPVNLTRSRWFDFPLTREESLVSDKKLTINFGPSFDPAGEF